MAALSTSYARDGVSAFSHRASRPSTGAVSKPRYKNSLDRLIAEQVAELKTLQWEIDHEDNAERKQKLQRHGNIKAGFLLRLQQEQANGQST